MFRLLRAIIRHKLKDLLFLQFLSYSFSSYCIRDLFCITNQSYCLSGIREGCGWYLCLVPTVFRIRGVGFAFVNLQVALVIGYGKGSCQLL